jgi:hypothetical protein
VADIKFCSIKDWTKISAIGRSSTYQMLADGRLKAKKFGAKVLIDVPAGLAFIASLPDAQFGQRD